MQNDLKLTINLSRYMNPSPYIVQHVSITILEVYTYYINIVFLLMIITIIMKFKYNFKFNSYLS